MRTVDRAEHAGRRARRGRAPRRRWSRRTRLLVAIAALGVGCWLAFAALQLWRARQEAIAGIDRLESLQETMSIDTISNGEDIAGIRDAHEHFRDANARAESAALTPLRFLPVVGRQIRSVDALTDAATDVTAIAEARLDDARVLLDTAEVDSGARVAFVRDIEQLALEAGNALEQIRLGPSDGLVGPLDRARDRFADELASLRTSADHIRLTSEAVAQLLEGPRTYLLLAANNAEMRIGSGAFLSVGVLTTDQGALALSDMESIPTFNLPDARVPLTGDLAARWGWLKPNQEWRNLGSSPRFDANAELGVQMWKASTGQDVDGVLAIDVIALRGLLAATGPVEVEGTSISADNVVEEVMFAQYLRPESRDEDARRERLSEIASAVVDRLQEGAWDPQTLASELVDVASGRHLLLWSRNAPEQAGWEAVTVAGGLQPESLLLGVHNRAGNKLDRFLTVEGELSTRTVDTGTEVTVRVHLRNTTPDGLPPRVAGPFSVVPGSAAGRYQGLLVLQMPGAARDVRGVGADELVASGPDGPNQVVATYVELDRGTELERTITFVLPGTDGSLRVEPSARVPGIEWSDGRTRWVDEKPRTVAW